MTNPPAPGNSPPSFADDIGELRCPSCDYDLRGTGSERCPECGLLLDRAGLSVSQIPWTHRHEMGRFRAFRRTCWMIFRRPKRAAADASRPVSFTDARRFQRAVIWAAYLPLLILGAWALYQFGDEHPFGRSGINGVTKQLPFFPSPHQIPPPGRLLGWGMEGVGVLFCAVCLWLFLKSITGVASYFFHPRDLSISRQNRAIALSYYACAPLAWTPISIALYAIGLLFIIRGWIDRPPGMQAGIIIIGSCFATIVVQLLSWWISTLKLLKHSTRCSGLRVLTAAICLPVLWIFCGVVTLLVLPAVYLFVCVVILSLL